LQSIST